MCVVHVSQQKGEADISSRGRLEQPGLTADKYETVTHREVRKQTGDLITLLEMAQPLSHYYLFMEDDFRCAPQGLHGWSVTCACAMPLPLQLGWLVCRTYSDLECLEAKNLCKQIYGRELRATP